MTLVETHLADAGRIVTWQCRECDREVTATVAYAGSPSASKRQPVNYLMPGIDDPSRPESHVGVVRATRIPGFGLFRHRPQYPDPWGLKVTVLVTLGFAIGGGFSSYWLLRAFLPSLGSSLTLGLALLVALLIGAIWCLVHVRELLRINRAARLFAPRFRAEADRDQGSEAGSETP